MWRGHFCTKQIFITFICNTRVVLKRKFWYRRVVELLEYHFWEGLLPFFRWKNDLESEQLPQVKQAFSSTSETALKQRRDKEKVHVRVSVATWTAAENPSDSVMCSDVICMSVLRTGLLNDLLGNKNKTVPLSEKLHFNIDLACYLRKKTPLTYYFQFIGGFVY